MRGGEGSGKSCAGIIKVLERARRGMSCIMASPDFEHFKKSLWPEFVRWCPADCVVAHQRYRLSPSWEAAKQFELFILSQTGTIVTLYCGGMDDPASWEGGNVSCAHLDEARRKSTPEALKVLDGRVRIAGPQGEPPQLWLTTTPRKHWLYEYFGELLPDDPRAAFKRDSLVVTLSTEDNERAGNLAVGYTQQRGQSLTESERRVLLAAEWEDIDEAERFLPSIAWWDACQETLPPVTRNEPLVLGVDAGVTNDYFALVGVTRHPQRKADVAVRYVRVWKPQGKPLDFDAIERELIETLLKRKDLYNLAQIAYDKYQLHQMMQHLKQFVWCKEFNQNEERKIADKQLLDLIQTRRIAHDGNAELRAALDNANRKTDQDTKTLRLVKRADPLKIDLAVALSMASSECLRLSLG